MLGVLAIAVPTEAWDVYAASQDGSAIPDVNKPDPANLNDKSCWQASAANILAAAGWGIGAGGGATAQQRANRIYNQLIAAAGNNQLGNVGNAMNGWIQGVGRNKDSADYDPNNLYTNVGWTADHILKCPDYRAILDGLNKDREVYASVLWAIPHGDDPPTKHWLTAVGGNYEECEDPTNATKSVWTDSDRTAGVISHDKYTNTFFAANNGVWRLVDYLAIDPDEYDTLSQGLALTPTAVQVYYCGLHRDPIYGTPVWSESGDKAGEYDDPQFADPVTLVVDNEPVPDKYKVVSLLVDYTDNVPGRQFTEIIELEDDLGGIWPATSVTPSADDGQLLFEWELPYQPAFEKILFPDTRYSTLSGNVGGLEVTTECVPEPVSLSLLMLGGLTLLQRGKSY